MVEGVGEHMVFIKDNFIDILIFVGVIFMSIGFFKLNLAIGFIATGLIIILVAFLMSRGGDE